MIKFDNTSFAYHRNRPVLSNLSLTIPQGSICGLLGKNGVGKSTMLYLMAGLLRPTSGSITTLGHTPSQRGTELLEDIFLVPEEFSLPSLSIRQYLKYTTPFYPRFSEEDMKKYMERFDMPMDLNLGSLSLGMKKKTFISFALATNTSVLLLDEPTNGLDITSKRVFGQCMSSAMTDDKAIVVSTHQVYDVEKLLDHVVIADNNGILLDEPMLEVMQRLAFSFTPDRRRAENALMSLEMPGGFNIVELLDNPDMETEVNLESLFELANSKPEQIKQIFSQIPSYEK